MNYYEEDCHNRMEMEIESGLDYREDFAGFEIERVQDGFNVYDVMYLNR